MEKELKYLCFILLLPALFVGCRMEGAEDTQAVKDLVMKYDRLLARSYLDLNTEGLKEVVTYQHLERLNHRLQVFKMTGRQMEADLKNKEFLQITFESGKTTKGKSAMVKTSEVWDTRHRNMETGEIMKETRGLQYILSYELVKQDRTWLVESVTVLEEHVR